MRRKHFLTCTTFLLLISSDFAFAQRDSIRVHVFNGTEPVTSSTNYFDKNFIRLNYSLIARGAFTIGIERILHDKHAVTLDVGLTYRDFIYEFSFDEGIDFENAEVKAGTYLDVAYKFYPGRYHNFDGEFYLSPGAITRNYNVFQHVDVYDGSNYRTEKVDKSYSMREAYLKFGYVSEGRIFDDLIVDIYCGLGLREVRSNTYEIQTANSGTEKVVTMKDIQSLPAIYAGLRIGLTF
jgi:hypothetical protein